MNILFLTPYLPYPLNNGGLIRVYHLLTNIATRHQVTLLCMEPDNEKQREGIALIKAKGIQVILIPVAASQKKENKRLYQLLSLFSNKTYQYHQYYSPEMQQAITEQLDSKKYDLLMVEFSQMGYYDITTDIPRYVDQHNVEYEIMQRTYETEKSPLRKLLARSEWKKYRHHEIENCEKFTACLTTSKRDAEILKERSARLECHVIPNGVDSDFFSPAEDEIDPNMILFTGTISYYPNTEGILWFHQNIWPKVKELKPDATFCIAGKAPPAEVQHLAKADKQIVVTGAVDDMRDYYAKAAVVVVPLRVGGGTRLKILEGMAMGKAIISTTVGAEGIDHTEGKNILLRDEPDDFASAIAGVMDDFALRTSLGREGRVLVEQKYDWQAVGNTLCNVFESNAGAA
jgi:sugar transferase (PEP-CTERM/EpsH1 system associated)